MSRVARRQTLFIIVFLVVVFLFVLNFRMGLVRGISMEPTYQDGQLVLVRRRNWFSPALRRNDVVLLRQGRDVIIKRVYRLSGEEIDDTFPDVKEQALRTPGISDYYEQDPITPQRGVRPRLKVPEGYIVILGDNLPASEDSRIFGPVPVSDILGVVVNSPGPPYAAQLGRSGLVAPSNGR